MKSTKAKNVSTVLLMVLCLFLSKIINGIMRGFGIVPFLIYLFVLFVLRIIMYLKEKKERQEQGLDAETKFFKRDTELSEEEKVIRQKENKTIIFASLISLIVVFASCLCVSEFVFLKSEVKEQKATIEVWNKIANDKNAEMKQLKDKCDFYDCCVVFCDDESDFYHTYECEEWNRNSFYVFNSENAETQGYKPCPKCGE